MPKKNTSPNNTRTEDLTSEGSASRVVVFRRATGINIAMRSAVLRQAEDGFVLGITVEQASELLAGLKRMLGQRAALECPCCGDVGATADADGLFYDGQSLECGCPGQVSCDSETAPYTLTHDEPCPKCDLNITKGESNGRNKNT